MSKTLPKITVAGKEEFKQLQKRVAALEEYIASIDETENCEEYIREFMERS
ncbi:hypothetical protein [Aneurinibacillus aneurinilyticus]|uniref:hypothetical protein n=1 Tax=Aneurinibacillus aneurinilyticus TaxID=1391 RepID=UPI00366ED359